MTARKKWLKDRKRKRKIQGKGYALFKIWEHDALALPDRDLFEIDLFVNCRDAWEWE